VYRRLTLSAILLLVTTARGDDASCKTDEAKYCKGKAGKELAKCMDSHKTDLSESCQITVKKEADRSTNDAKKSDPFKAASPVEKAGALFNPTGDMGSTTK